MTQGSSRRFASQLLSEFLGTGMFVFTIGMVVPTNGEMAPLAIGLALSVMVYCCGSVSGGHLNPAVSVGLLVRKELTPGETAGYVAAQLCGAALFASFAKACFPHTMGHPYLPDVKMVLEALCVEFIITFLLVYTVTHVATHAKAAGNSYFGLAIGFTVLSGAVSVGPISGGAFNPAVSMLTLVDGGDSLGQIWIWWAGPLAGGICAGALFRVLHPDQTTRDGSSEPAEPVAWSKYVIEFIGTFSLCFTVAMAAPSGSNLTGLAIGSMLMCQVYAGGPHSGGHYNPAVSLAIFAQQKGGITFLNLILYVFVQLVAGLAAGLVAPALLGKPAGYPVPASAADLPADFTDFHVAAVTPAFLAEFVATCMLCLVVLNTACSESSSGNSYFGFAIGMTVTTMAYSVGPISGGALNPAVAMLGFYRSDGLWWGYFVACPLGGLLAALVWRLQHCAGEEAPPPSDSNQQTMMSLESGRLGGD